jgi:hypothetical protein
MAHLSFPWQLLGRFLSDKTLQEFDFAVGIFLKEQWDA